MSQDSSDDKLRISYYESFIVSSPIQFGAIVCSLILFYYPSITNRPNIKFFFLYAMHTFPFLFTIFMFPLYNYFYISIPCLIFVWIYIIWTLFSFNNPISICGANEINQLASDEMETNTKTLISCSVESHQDNVISKRRRSLAIYRGGLYIACTICIIGRECLSFRMAFARAETFGTGLMDCGIGSFVILLGVLGPSKQWMGNRTSDDKKRVLLYTIVSSLFIAILGAVIKICIRSLELPYDIGKYGRDMNVFFVMAITKLIGNICELLSYKIVPFWISSLVIAISYEFILSTYQLKPYILTHNLKGVENENFINANREGIFPIIGFVALYFSGAFIGQKLFNTKLSCPGFITKPTYKMAITLFSLSFVISVCFKLAEMKELIDEPSRGLGNMSYHIWMISLFLYNVGVAYVIEMNEDQMYKRSFPPKSYTEYIDFCGLEYISCCYILWILIKTAFLFVSNENWNDIILNASCTIGLVFISIKLHTYFKNTINLKIL